MSAGKRGANQGPPRDDGEPLTPAEAALAEGLEFVFAGRPDHVAQAYLATQPAEVRRALGELTNAMALLGLAEAPRAPSPGLRGRILATLAAKAPARKALVVVDMIVDYLTPGRPMEVPRARAVLPAVKARIDAARAQGVPVVFTVDRHEADDPDLDLWCQHAVAGTEGSEVWPELGAAASDPVVGHPTYSAFSRSSLDEVLRGLGVDTLVMAGCLTELQIFTTATDALQRGYAVEVAEGCHGGGSEVAEQSAVNMLRMLKPYGPARRDLLASVNATATPAR